MDIFQTIYNCGLKFDFVCSKKWQEMPKVTDKEEWEKFGRALEIRHCSDCNKSVYMTDSTMGLAIGVQKELCMAIKPEDFMDSPKNTGRLIPKIEAKNLKNMRESEVTLGVIIERE